MNKEISKKIVSIKTLCLCMIVCIICNVFTFYGFSNNNVYAKNTLEIKNEVSKELDNKNSVSIAMNNNLKQFQTNISKNGFCRIEIKNNTEPVTIKAFGKNIYNGSYDLGFIKDDTKEVLNSNNNKHYKTTKWIQVYPGQKLTISGNGVNRNIWEFKSADLKKYEVKKASTVQIPYEMAWARVFYSSDINGDVQIEYGSSTTKYEKYKESSITIPAAKDKKIFKNSSSLLSYNGLTTFSAAGKNIGDVLIYYPKMSTPDDNGSYGVRWSLTELTEKCERIEDSVGLSANATEGDLPVSNDFDSIYPWSEMKICNIDSEDKITYQGQKEFAYDGSNGNVFVEIPKWYVKRYQDATHEYLYISKIQKEGYEIEPAFIEGTQILDKIYIAAYDGYVTNENKLVSWSGKYPTTNLSLSTYRNYARANGSLRYGVLDMRCIIALQHLYLVEFANKNSSKTIGMGLQKMQFPFTKSAVISEKNSNRIILTNNAAKVFKVGQSCEISEKGDYKMQHRIIKSFEAIDESNMAIYFTGLPYNVNASSTYIYNTPLTSGMCDTMAAPSGYAFGAINGNGFTSVRYRFIENPWGNIWNCVDGVVVEKCVPAICYDMTKYISSGSADYIPLGYSLPVQKEHGYKEEYVKVTIKNLGYDKKYPSIGFPVEIGNGANKDNSFADSWYGFDGPKQEVRWKGAWDLGIGVADRAGLFILRAWFGVDKPYWHDGARLMYKPINLTENN